MTTTTPANPGWRVQLAIHRAVRRDVARLGAALQGGPGVADAAISYWDVTASQLHHHHEFEDAVVWPLLGERLGGRVESLLARNLEEHGVMAAAMDGFDAALRAGADAGDAPAALVRLAEAVEHHLAHEEADVLPLIPEAFTMEDIAYFQAEDAKTNPAAEFLPWMLDDAPEADVAFFTGRLPAPVLDLLTSNWSPARRRLVDSIVSRETVTSSTLR